MPTRSRAASPARDRWRYVLVGLGGIGGRVLRELVPFLHALGPRATVLAVDGDTFEERNRDRQLFGRPGRKAEVLVEELAETYGDRVALVPVARYVTARTVAQVIDERSVVFCQPDNNATRALVARHCARLRDAVLLTGGNDDLEDGKTGTYGNVHIYVRRAGRDRTNPPTRHHPEIAHPKDKLPTTLGCAAVAAAGAPQLGITNLAVATGMLAAFRAWREGTLDYEELYLDVALGRMSPVRREVSLAFRPAPGHGAYASSFWTGEMRWRLLMGC